jgi:hypothetical protein
MPDVQEVFRVATQKIRPDPGALERQQIHQRRWTTRRKVGAYAVAAALIAAIAVVAVRTGIVGSSERLPTGGNPTTAPSAVPDAGPVGTVTSDGTTCSIELTGADPIEPGFAVFEVVNDTDERAMFDSWALADGFGFDAFERAVADDVAFAERGEVGGAWPGEDKVTYLRSDVVRPHQSATIAVPFSTGTNAITCLKPFEGLGFRPYGIAGPIVVR